MAAASSPRGITTGRSLQQQQGHEQHHDESRCKQQKVPGHEEQLQLAATHSSGRTLAANSMSTTSCTSSTSWAATAVGRLVEKKRRLISVADTTTVADSLQVMRTNGIMALPISAPPGKWLGAGASTVIDGNRQYIGLVSMVDVAIHIATSAGAPISEDQTLGMDAAYLDFVSTTGVKEAMRDDIARLIGETDEGLSLWVFDERTSLLDVMEPLSKGIHRVLIFCPAERHRQGRQQEQQQQQQQKWWKEQELALGDAEEETSDSSYRFLSQMDVASFLLGNIDRLFPLIQAPLSALGLVNASLFPPLAVPFTASVIDTLRLMRNASPPLTAVPVVDPFVNPFPPTGLGEGEEEEEEVVGLERELIVSPVGISRGDSFNYSAAAAVASTPPPPPPLPAPVLSLQHPRHQMPHQQRPVHGTAGVEAVSMVRPFARCGWQHGGRVVDTFSTSDLRELEGTRLVQLLKLKVSDFLHQIAFPFPRHPPITCRPLTPLADVISLLVVNHVHRIWVTTEEQQLVGVVTISDVISVCRKALLSATSAGSTSAPADLSDAMSAGTMEGG